MTFPVSPGVPVRTNPFFPHWSDRIKPGAYRSPSGKRVEFQFEDVSRQIDLRRTPFVFPGVDGVYVQRHGRGATRYPLRCYFTGTTHDLEATAFEAALIEDGVGRLEHPFYGTFDAVPVGTITRRDDLKNQANQTVIEVSFWPTLRAVYPTSQSSPENEILAAIEGFSITAAQGFERVTDLRDTVKRAGLVESLRKSLGEISNALDKVSNAVSSVNREYREVEALLHQGLTTFVGQPLMLAQQIVNLTTAPSRTLSGLRSRLDQYSDFAKRLGGASASDTSVDATSSAAGLTRAMVGSRSRLDLDSQYAERLAASATSSDGASTAAVKPTQARARGLVTIDDRLGAYTALSTAMIASEAGNPGDALTASVLLTDRTGAITNAFHAADLIAMSAVAGSIISTLGYNFRTKPETLAAADAILDQWDAIVAWRDAAFDDVADVGNNQIDQTGASQQMNHAVALAVGNLVQVSFSAIPERRVVLDRPRTIVDLAAELYGRVDEVLDDIVNDNNLTGDEILELPRGREIVYYPERAA